MNDDPLGLRDVSTPETLRVTQAAPLDEVSRIHSRLVSNHCADSLEAKTALIAHMVYLIYIDLKNRMTT